MLCYGRPFKNHRFSPANLSEIDWIIFSPETPQRHLMATNLIKLSFNTYDASYISSYIFCLQVLQLTINRDRESKQHYQVHGKASKLSFLEKNKCENT